MRKGLSSGPSIRLNLATFKLEMEAERSRERQTIQQVCGSAVPGRGTSQVPLRVLPTWKGGSLPQMRQEPERGSFTALSQHRVPQADVE